MSSSRLMSQELMISFIEEYKNNPCLWNTKLRKYHNKSARWAAYLKLVDLIEPHYPDADVNFVRKKLNTIHGMLRREHKKYSSSLSSGKTYKPTLWYYDRMSFITQVDNRYNGESFKNPDELCREEKESNEDSDLTTRAPGNNRQISRNLLIKFLKLYENSLCLWKRRHPSYTDIKLKNRAIDDLVQLVKSECPRADRNFIRKKINTLRGSARTEHKRYLEFEKNGKSEQYKSKLWYYDLIKFIYVDDFEKLTDAETDSEDFVQIQDKQIRVELFSELDTAGELLFNDDTESNKTGGSDITNEDLISFSDRKIDSMIYREEEYDEFYYYAKTIALKLRKIQEKDENQRFVGEKLINEILLRALQNKLTEKSALVEQIQILKGILTEPGIPCSSHTFGNSVF